ncbi:uncharacterized protein LOC143272431 [Peromyscus maniculatus bairdii]|uniref:uncharacterized protein LOC143272431 n=1 Tax=Peromyscus maniculatus bairdii TaxID=230844 RepID=UPI003FD6729C
MFSHFKDAGGGESHLGESPLSLPLDGFATFLTGGKTMSSTQQMPGDPFAVLEVPLGKIIHRREVCPVHGDGTPRWADRYFFRSKRCQCENSSSEMRKSRLKGRQADR